MTFAIDLKNVTVRRGDTVILDSVNWQVDEDERWVVIGPNGAGKSTLMSIVSAQLFPTAGTVSLLGETLGKVDVFELRPRIGVTSALLGNRVPDSEKVRDLVVSAAYGIVGRWREEYDDFDYGRAAELMGFIGVSHLADRAFGTLSEGERKRVLIARALMSDPEMLIMDEPGAGLDLAGREILVATLDRLCLDPYAPISLLVTHHVEDIPTAITHALLLNNGKVAYSGPVDEVITSAHMSEVFGVGLNVARVHGRFTAFAAEPDQARPQRMQTL